MTKSLSKDCVEYLRLTLCGKHREKRAVPAKTGGLTMLHFIVTRKRQPLAEPQFFK